MQKIKIPLKKKICREQVENQRDFTRDYSKNLRLTNEHWKWKTEVAARQEHNLSYY